MRSRSTDGDPRVELWGTLDDIAIWIVDGEQVRDTIDDDFTDYAQHEHKSYVPEDEIWIDDLTEPQERKFMATAAIRERSQMLDGKSFDLAHDEVDAESFKERSVDFAGQETIDAEPWQTFGSIEVFLVDGEVVRDRLTPDWVYGGHDLVYRFIPKGQVWLERDLDDAERPVMLLHELWERGEMLAGAPFTVAHRDANDIERIARRDPEKLQILLEEATAMNDRPNKMTIGLSSDALKAMATDPEFVSFMKGEPAAASVHVSNANGDARGKKKHKPKMLDFDEILSTVDAKTHFDKKDEKDDRLEKVLAEMDAAHQAEHDFLAKEFGLDFYEPPMRERAMHQIDKQEGLRHLKPHEDGGAYSPFPIDPHAMSMLHPEQMRRFLGALTNQNDQEDKTVGINTLIGLQPRVDPDKIEAMGRKLEQGRTNKADLKKPLIVRWGGKNYLADGHHRAAAHWLAGAKSLDVKFCDLSGDDDELNKEWLLEGEFHKVDIDRQLLFGVASTVQEGDYLVVDKQGDVITPQALEDAVYEYVLEARAHDKMHTGPTTGRLVESFVITPEKRAALKAHGFTLSFKNASGAEVSGWLTGYKVDDASTWAKVKSGELPELSIGGSGARVEI
jgi:Putative phage serine protease XkdF/ParB-like nuclease domain